MPVQLDLAEHPNCPLIASKNQFGGDHDCNGRKVIGVKKYYRWDIVWRNVAVMVYFHVGAVYGIYLLFVNCAWATIIWSFYLQIIGTLGATAGAHRLWTHNSYKAKLPLRILLAYFQSTCYQNSIHEWVRDHRVHHKYSDTDADPHNAKRGLFFSHIGWLLISKQKDVITKGRTISLKDVESDPVVMFQKNYYLILMPFCCFVIPALVPWYLFGESFTNAWHVASLLRHVTTLNAILSINSIAHAFGTRPYDNNILAVQNKSLSYLLLGEGWHNFHHVFPCDYKTSEFNGYCKNLTTGFIDCFAQIGWAYDLKCVSGKVITDRFVGGKNRIETLPSERPVTQ